MKSVLKFVLIKIRKIWALKQFLTNSIKITPNFRTNKKIQLKNLFSNVPVLPYPMAENLNSSVSENLCSENSSVLPLKFYQNSSVFAIFLQKLHIFNEFTKFHIKNRLKTYIFKVKI